MIDQFVAKRRTAWVADLAYPVASLLAVILFWEAAVYVFDIVPFVLPAPSRVIGVIAMEWSQLTTALGFTLIEVLAGFALSVVAGVLLGVAIVTWRPVEKALYPILVSFQIVPKVAIAPLFVVWFGFGLLPKILMAFLIGFFPMIVSTVTGLKSIEENKVLLAKSMGATPRQTFIKFQLPHAMPGIFSGMKLSITAAMIGAVVGEFIGADRGIGRLLLITNGNMQTDLLFAGVIVLSATGVALFVIIEQVERRVLHWHVSQRSSNVGSVG